MPDNTAYQKAIDLIMNSELKLYNISQLVGYDDPKYFSKVFKSYFGFPPSRFKEVNGEK